MTTYTAYFRTDGEYATEEFEADTPEQALALARRFYSNDPLALYFEPNDGSMPMNEIEITSSDKNELALWRDDDLWLSLAARDMFEALQAIFKRWTETSTFQNGDDEMPAGIFDAMRFAIAKAKGRAL
jgi:hypothetical protein